MITQIVKVTSIDELIAALNAEGTSQIALLGDIDLKGNSLSCTRDILVNAGSYSFIASEGSSISGMNIVSEADVAIIVTGNNVSITGNTIQTTGTAVKSDSGVANLVVANNDITSTGASNVIDISNAIGTLTVNNNAITCANVPACVVIKDGTAAVNVSGNVISYTIAKTGEAIAISAPKAAAVVTDNNTVSDLAPANLATEAPAFTLATVGFNAGPGIVANVVDYTIYLRCDTNAGGYDPKAYRDAACTIDITTEVAAMGLSFDWDYYGMWVMKDFSFSTTADTAIYCLAPLSPDFDYITSTEFVVEGSNTITVSDSSSSDTYGIRGFNTLTFTKSEAEGDATLTVTAGNGLNNSYGFYVPQDLSFKDITVTAQSGTAAKASAGILVGNGLTLSGGTVTATGKDYGVLGGSKKPFVTAKDSDNQPLTWEQVGGTSTQSTFKNGETIAKNVIMTGKEPTGYTVVVVTSEMGPSAENPYDLGTDKTYYISAGEEETQYGGAVVVNGGFIYEDVAFATGSNLTFEANKGFFGGAFCNYGTTTLVGGVFSNNQNFLNASYAYGASGAFFNGEGASLTVTGNIIFEDNVGYSVGAISNDANGKITLENGTFTNNISPDTGENVPVAGAIATFGDSEFTATGKLVFEGNTSGTFGGAIVNGGKFTMKDGSFKSNYARSEGGAIYNSIEFTVTGDLLFEGNYGGEGGAIDNSGVFNMVGGTFTNNSAVSNGGAIDNYITGKFTATGDLLFSGNTITGTDVKGGAINNDGAFNMVGGTFTNNSVIFSDEPGSNSGGAIYNDNTGNFTATGDLLFSGNTVTGTGGKDGAIYNLGTFTFSKKLTLATDTDTIYNGADGPVNGSKGVLNWDITSGVSSYAQLNGWDKLTNNGALTITVKEDTQGLGSYTIATGATAAITDTFTVKIADDDDGISLTVGADPVSYMGRAYSLTQDDNYDLVLNVTVDYTIYVGYGKLYKDETWKTDITEEVAAMGLSYDSGNETWVMDNFHFNTTAKNGIYCNSWDTVNFSVKGSNSITVKDNASSDNIAGIAGYDLKFVGSGENASLTVTAGNGKKSSFGIYVEEGLSFESMTLTTEGGTAETSSGIYVEYQNLTFKDAIVTATGKSSSQNSSSGIYVGNTLKVFETSSKVTATGEDYSVVSTNQPLVVAKTSDGQPLTWEQVGGTSTQFTYKNGETIAKEAILTAKESCDRVVVTTELGPSAENPYDLGTGKNFYVVGASEEGGAVKVEEGAFATGAKLSFEFNEGNYGGAIYNAGTTTLAGGTFTKNRVTSGENAARGGAIYNSEGGLLTATDDLVFEGNVALGEFGGAIFNYGTVVIVNGTFKNNVSDNDGGGGIGNGGAIYNSESSSFTATGDLYFEGNTAFAEGGAIENCWGTFTMANGVFKNNSSRGQYAGAIDNNRGSFTVTGDLYFEGNKGDEEKGAIDNTGTFNFSKKITLVTDTDTIRNMDTLNWDVTGGTASHAKLIGWDKLTNNGTLTITVKADTQELGSYTIATGATAAITDTFTVKTADNEGVSLAVNKTVFYKGRVYSLVQNNTSKDLILRVSDYSIYLNGGKAYYQDSFGSDSEITAEVAAMGLSYDSESKKWIMNNFSFTTTEGAGLVCVDKSTTFTVKGSNSVTTGEGAFCTGIMTVDENATLLSFQGSGEGATLTVTAGNATNASYGIISQGDLVFSDITVSAKSGTATTLSTGIGFMGSMSVLGLDSTVTASGKVCGVVGMKKPIGGAKDLDGNTLTWAEIKDVPQMAGMSSYFKKDGTGATDVVITGKEPCDHVVVTREMGPSATKAYDLGDGKTYYVVDRGVRQGGAVIVEQRAYAKGNDLTFEDNIAVGDGGAIYNANGYFAATGVFMFTGNTAESGNGGAIYNNAGNFGLMGGTFSNNVAGGNGGAIASDGTFTTTDALSFGGNVAGTYGGAIGNTGRFFAKSAMTFTGNTAKSGGAIVSGSDLSSTTFSMADGTFTDNVATSGDGGAIYNNGRTFKMAGGTFSKNIASGSGGAIGNTGGFTATGALTFDGNTSAKNAGAIYNTLGGFTATSSMMTFTNNVAGSGSGGAVVNENTFKMADGVFIGNTANQTGGAIFNLGTFSMGAGTFSNNIAETAVGGAIGNGGTFIATGDLTFDGNTSAKNAGAVANFGTFTFAKKLTLVTDTDTIYNGADGSDKGVLNWDIRGGTASHAQLNGWNKLTNDGGDLTITVKASQEIGSYTIVTGATAAITDTFIIKTPYDGDTSSISLTVDANPILYKGRYYSLTQNAAHDLILNVTEGYYDYTIYLNNDCMAYKDEALTINISQEVADIGLSYTSSGWLMDNFHFTTIANTAINSYTGYDSVSIDVNGNNSIVVRDSDSSDTCGIYAYDIAFVKSLLDEPANLTVTVGDGLDNSYGIYAEGDLTFKEMTATLQSGTAATFSAGIYFGASGFFSVASSDSITSTVTASGKGYGVYGENKPAGVAKDPSGNVLTWGLVEETSGQYTYMNGSDVAPDVVITGKIASDRIVVPHFEYPPENPYDLGTGKSYFVCGESSEGGAVDVVSGAAAKGKDLTFEFNRTIEYGGAICNGHPNWGSGASTFTATGNFIFADNRAQKSGGAIFNGSRTRNNAVFTMESGTFTDNFANGGDSRGGGAIYNGSDAGTATFTATKDLVFSGNGTDENGGAIYNARDAVFTMVGGTFTNNSANIKGGAIENEGTFTATGDLVFAGNKATQEDFSGAIHNAGVFNFSKKLTLATDTDTLYNAGALNWDITGGASSYAQLNGWDKLTNEGALTITVKADTQGLGAYTLATGATAAITDTFIVKTADDDGFELTVGADPVTYMGKTYSLVQNDNYDLVLNVMVDYTIYLIMENGWYPKAYKDAACTIEITTNELEAMGMTWDWSGDGQWIMNDFHFNTTAATAICCFVVPGFESPMNFVIKGSNSITSSNSNSSDTYGIKGADSITVKGEGENATLTVTAGNGKDNSYGIYATKDLLFESVTVTAQSGTAAKTSSGLYVGGSQLTVTDANVTATGKAAESSSGVYVNGKSLVIGSSSKVIATGEDYGVLGGTKKPFVTAKDSDNQPLTWEQVGGTSTQFTFKNGETIAKNVIMTAKESCDRIVVDSDTGTAENPYDLGTGKTYYVVDASEEGGAVLVEEGAHAKGNNLTFEGNKGRYGGAFCNYGTTTLVGGVFSDNQNVDWGGEPGYGAALYNGEDASLTVSGNIIFEDNVGHAGGAIYNELGKITLENGTFTNNISPSDGLATPNGGAINNDNGEFTATGNLVFEGNTAGYDGGAVYNVGTFTMKDGSFKSNYSGKYGGAIIHHAGKFTATGELYFEENSSSEIGGAIYNGNSFHMTGGTFTNNSAGSNGGAINNVGNFTATGDLLFSGNTVTETGGKGGAVANFGNFNFSKKLTLATDTDTIHNTGTLNWDITGGTASHAQLNGWDKLTNDGGTLTITVKADTQDVGAYTIATGATAAITDTFTVKTADNEGVSLTVGANPFIYKGRTYSLTQNDNYDLILNVENTAPVCKIGDKTYYSMVDAFAEVTTDQTITVLNDSAEPVETLSSNKQFSIDLAGRSYECKSLTTTDKTTTIGSTTGGVFYVDSLILNGGNIALAGDAQFVVDDSIAIGAGSQIELNTSTRLTTKTWTNNGTVTVDLSDATASIYKIVDTSDTSKTTIESFGNVTLNSADYTLFVEDNDLYAKKKTASVQEADIDVDPSTGTVTVTPGTSTETTSYANSVTTPGDVIVQNATTNELAVDEIIADGNVTVSNEISGTVNVTDIQSSSDVTIRTESNDATTGGVSAEYVTGNNVYIVHEGSNNLNVTKSITATGTDSETTGVAMSIQNVEKDSDLNIEADAYVKNGTLEIRNETNQKLSASGKLDVKNIYIYNNDNDVNKLGNIDITDQIEAAGDIQITNTSEVEEKGTGTAKKGVVNFGAKTHTAGADLVITNTNENTINGGYDASSAEQAANFTVAGKADIDNGGHINANVTAAGNINITNTSDNTLLGEYSGYDVSINNTGVVGGTASSTKITASNNVNIFGSGTVTNTIVDAEQMFMGGANVELVGGSIFNESSIIHLQYASEDDYFDNQVTTGAKLTLKGDLTVKSIIEGKYTEGTENKYAGDVTMAGGSLTLAEGSAIRANSITVATDATTVINTTDIIVNGITVTGTLKVDFTALNTFSKAGTISGTGNIVSTATTEWIVGDSVYYNFLDASAFTGKYSMSEDGAITTFGLGDAPVTPALETKDSYFKDGAEVTIADGQTVNLKGENFTTGMVFTGAGNLNVFENQILTADNSGFTGYVDISSAKTATFKGKVNDTLNLTGATAVLDDALTNTGVINVNAKTASGDGILDTLNANKNSVKLLAGTFTNVTSTNGNIDLTEYASNATAFTSLAATGTGTIYLTSDKPVTVSTTLDGNLDFTVANATYTAAGVQFTGTSKLTYTDAITVTAASDYFNTENGYTLIDTDKGLTLATDYAITLTIQDVATEGTKQVKVNDGAKIGMRFYQLSLVDGKDLVLKSFALTVDTVYVNTVWTAQPYAEVFDNYYSTAKSVKRNIGYDAAVSIDKAVAYIKGSTATGHVGEGTIELTENSIYEISSTTTLGTAANEVTNMTLQSRSDWGNAKVVGDINAGLATTLNLVALSVSGSVFGAGKVNISGTATNRFSGPYIAANGDLNIAGGLYSTRYVAGGYATAAATVGNASVSIEGVSGQRTSFSGSIYGGYIANGATVKMGNASVTIDATNSVSLLANIYAGGAAISGGSLTVDGTRTVTFKGTGSNLDFLGTVYGGALGVTGMDTGKATLVFDSFSGNFNGGIVDFGKVVISGNSSVNLCRAQSKVSGTALEFKVTSDTTTANAMYTLRDSKNWEFGKNITVTVDGTGIAAGSYTYTLVGNLASAEGLTFTINGTAAELGKEITIGSDKYTLSYAGNALTLAYTKAPVLLQSAASALNLNLDDEIATDATADLFASNDDLKIQEDINVLSTFNAVDAMLGSDALNSQDSDELVNLKAGKLA